VITASTPAATPNAAAAVPRAPGAGAAIVRPGEGESVRAFGNEIVFKLNTENTNGLMSLGLATVAPGQSPPAHVHHREEELFLILEGQYRFFVNGEWIEDIGPGSVVFLPRGVTHTFQVVGATPGKHWTMQTPSGFERYFKEAGEVFAATTPPDFGRLAALNEQYGYSFVRP